MTDARAAIERLVLALRQRGEGESLGGDELGAGLFAPDVVIERFAPPTEPEAPAPTEPAQVITSRDAALAWVRLTPAGVDFALDGDMLPVESVAGRFAIRYRYWIVSSCLQNGGWWHFEANAEGITWLAHRPDPRPED